MKKTILFLSVCLFIFSGCLDNDKVSNQTEETSNQAEENSVETITFGEAITTDGQAVVNGNQVTISKGGNYILTGTSDDASVVIDAPDEDITLTLSDLTLSSSNSAAIIGIEANNIDMIVEGENTLSDTTSNTDAYQAPLYVDEIEMHITGDGTLNLNGNYQEGLESNNDLYIEGATLNIEALDDGINTGDLLDISGGEININSNGDGLDSNGDLNITGGEIYISAGNNGNGPIDYGEGYEFTLSGGILIATGGTMASVPSEATQTYLTTQTSGTSVSVGNYDYEAPKSFSYVIVSYPELTEQEDVIVDGEVADASQSTEMQMGGMQMDEMSPGFRM